MALGLQRVSKKAKKVQWINTWMYVHTCIYIKLGGSLSTPEYNVKTETVTECVCGVFTITLHT